MLTVKLDNKAQRSWLNSIAGGIRSETPAILDECGQTLMELEKVYFTRLSRGGTGYSGRAWAPPSARTVRRRKALAARGQLAGPAEAQGIVTGEMINSLYYQVSGGRLKVSFSDPKAYFFNIHRRLIPSRLPTEWRKACDAIVSRHLLATVGNVPQ